MLKQSGITDTNFPVLSGVGWFTFTKGVPLEIVLDYFRVHNFICDWIDYIDHAIKDGHNTKTIKSRISSAVGEVYGPKYRDEVNKKVDYYLSD